MAVFAAGMDGTYRTCGIGALGFVSQGGALKTAMLFTAIADAGVSTRSHKVKEAVRRCMEIRGASPGIGKRHTISDHEKVVTAIMPMVALTIEVAVAARQSSMAIVYHVSVAAPSMRHRRTRD